MAAGRDLAQFRKARPQMRTYTLLLLTLVSVALAGCKQQSPRPDGEPPPPPVTHQVSLTVTGPGMVEDSDNGINCTATCNYTFAQGRVLNLTQRPDAGAHFTTWSGACSTAEPCSVSVSGPLDIGATFVADGPPPPPGTHQVSLTVTGPGMVEDAANGINCTATCNYNLAEDLVLNLTPRPDADAHFTTWSGDCSAAGVCSVSVSGPLDIGAAFVADSPPPPPPPPPGAVLESLLNFAETWDRNWNFDGHTVTSEFTEDYGYWEYTDTTYEPWLFDRATVGYRLYELTGNTRWRDKFLSDFAWYREHIDAEGIFTPKGFSDTKYGYVTPFLLYERMAGDQQYRPIAKRIYDSWIREWPDDFDPDAALWTERELAFALEAAVSWYEMSGDAAALTRAQALVNQWTVASGTVGAPLVTYTQHEGGGPGGTEPTNLTNSPWMSALYFQAARRYFALTNDTEVLAQASRYADWLDANGFYDAALAHPEFSGLVFPRYLTGELIGDAGYDEGNMGHCLDVGGLLKFALDAKQQRGEPLTTIENRYAHMQACGQRDFENWTRDTTYLPKYRVNPPRKFNWQLRGYYEDSL